MLDLFISYMNFLIIGIKYIVRIIAFQPPNPKGYRIKKEANEINELQGIRLTRNENIEILFVIPKKPNNNDKNKKPKNKKQEEEYNRKNRILEYRPAPNRYADYELVYMDSEDNTKIPAFIFKPHNSNFFDPYNLYNYDLNRYIIIYCHGNSGDIGTSFMECQLLSMNLQCDVLCFEYPGYGLSSDVQGLITEYDFDTLSNYFFEEIKIDKNIAKYKLKNEHIVGNLTLYNKESYLNDIEIPKQDEQSENIFRLELFNNDIIHSNLNIVFLSIILPYID